MATISATASPLRSCASTDQLIVIDTFLPGLLTNFPSSTRPFQPQFNFPSSTRQVCPPARTVQPLTRPVRPHTNFPSLTRPPTVDTTTPQLHVIDTSSLTTLLPGLEVRPANRPTINSPTNGFTKNYQTISSSKSFFVFVV